MLCQLHHFPCYLLSANHLLWNSCLCLQFHCLLLVAPIRLFDCLLSLPSLTEIKYPLMVKIQPSFFLPGGHFNPAVLEYPFRPVFLSQTLHPPSQWPALVNHLPILKESHTLCSALNSYEFKKLLPCHDFLVLYDSTLPVYGQLLGRSGPFYLHILHPIPNSM